MQEHELKYDGCTYRCYLKSVKMPNPVGEPERSYFRVYCRRVDPKCKRAMHKQAVERALVVGKTVPQKVLSEYPGVKGVLEPAPPYHRMTIGKFIDKYEFQIGDPVVSHARAFAKETKPGLPRGIDALEIVKATITGFFTSKMTGEPMAKLRAGKIIAYSFSKGPVDPKSKHADALKDWEGVNSINEIGYGEVHKRFSS